MNTTIPFPTKMTGRMLSLFCLLIALSLTLGSAGAAWASKAIELPVTRNKSHVIKQSVPIKRVSVSNPKIADVVEISPTEVQVNGIEYGTTTLIIWDKYDKKTFFDVSVVLDLVKLKDEIARIAPGDDVRVEMLSANTLIAKGDVSTVDRWYKLEKTLTGYVSAKKEIHYLEGGGVIETESDRGRGGGAGMTLINLLEVPDVPQVLLQITVASIDRNATRELGINWSYFGKNANIMSTVTSGLPVNEFINLISGSKLGSNEVQFQNNANFGVVHWPSGTAYMLRALSGKGLAKILAEPNLIVKSGEAGHFLAGGEFPIPVVTTASAGETAPITVTFKEFGVRLNFEPVVKDSGLIQLKLAPAEVSSLDFANAVTVSGFNIPALVKDSVETSVDLMEGETFVMAGLIRSEWSKNLDKFPLLGDLPIIGAFFREQNMRKTERELIFLVTPKLIKPMKPGERVALPGSNEPTAAQQDDLRWIPMLPNYRSGDAEQLR